MVGRPQTLGFQADMAHTMLFTMAKTRRKTRCCRRTSILEGRRACGGLPQMAEALRPWTIDFHVAQNDGTVKGAGSHDKTGRHCPAVRPHGNSISSATPAHGCAAMTGSRPAPSNISAGTAACSPIR